MASHDYPTDFPVGLPLTDAETPRAFLPGATTPSARQLPPVGLPLQAGRGPFMENDMAYDNDDLTEVCKLLAECFLTDEDIANLAADIPGEMDRMFGKCEGCGARTTTDEADFCDECNEHRIKREYAHYKPLYDGEVRAGLHNGVVLK